MTRLETRGFTLTANELARARGSETRPAPYDYLAIALVTYTATTMRVYADRKEWQVGEIGVRVEHDRVHADDCEDCEHTTGHVERLERTIHLPDGIPDTQRDCSAHR